MTITSYVSKNPNRLKNDHQNYNLNKDFLTHIYKQGCSIESVKFSDAVQKINKRGEYQRRDFVLTDRTLYNVSPTDKRVRRAIPLSDILKIYKTEKDVGEIVIAFKWFQNDYRFTIVHLKGFLRTMNTVYKRLYNKTLEIEILEKIVLKDAQTFSHELKSYCPIEASRAGSSAYRGMSAAHKAALFDKYFSLDLIESTKNLGRLVHQHWKTGKYWQLVSRNHGLLARKKASGVLEPRCVFVVDGKIVETRLTPLDVEFFQKGFVFRTSMCKQEIRDLLFDKEVHGEDKKAEFSESLKELMKATLSSKTDRDHFFDYLVKHLMEEYLLCYEEILEFRSMNLLNNKKREEAQRVAININNTYLIKDAPFELANANTYVKEISPQLLAGALHPRIFQRLESYLIDSVLYNAFFRYFRDSKNKEEQNEENRKNSFNPEDNHLAKNLLCYLCGLKIKPKYRKKEISSCKVCKKSTCEKHRTPWVGLGSKDYTSCKGGECKTNCFCLLCYFVLIDRAVCCFAVQFRRKKKNYARIFGSFSKREAEKWEEIFSTKQQYYRDVKFSSTEKEIVYNDLFLDQNSPIFSYISNADYMESHSNKMENFMKFKKTESDGKFKQGFLLMAPESVEPTQNLPPKEKWQPVFISVQNNVFYVHSIDYLGYYTLPFGPDKKEALPERVTQNKAPVTMRGIYSESFGFGISIFTDQGIQKFYADSLKERRAWIECFDNRGVLAIDIDEESIDFSPLDFNSAQAFAVKRTLVPKFGYLVFVLTDIQNSTRLWQSLGEVMKRALEKHNEVLKRLLTKYDGHLLRTEGDAFIVAFECVVKAVQWAIDAQETLNTTKWDENLYNNDCAKRVFSEDGKILFSGLRIRIGIHAGMPDTKRNPTTGRDEYIGPVMVKANSLANSGNGGQIVISEESLEHLNKENKDFLISFGYETKRLGVYILQGLDDEMGIYSIYSKLLKDRKFGEIRLAKRIGD